MASYPLIDLTNSSCGPYVIVPMRVMMSDDMVRIKYPLDFLALPKKGTEWVWDVEGNVARCSKTNEMMQLTVC